MTGRWRLRLGRRGVVLASAAVVTLVAAAEFAYATIPDNNKLFTACMLKTVGTVRLIDPSLPSSSLMSHCTSLEAQVAWNQQGQTGTPGATGAAGPAGPAGKDGSDGKDGQDGVSVTESPAGASCANGGVALTAANGTGYVCNGADGGSASSAAFSTAFQTAVTFNAGFPVVASLQLDPGNYVLSGSVRLASGSPYPNRFFCQLNGSQLVDAQTVDVDPLNPNDSTTLTGTTTLTQPQTVTIHCGSSQQGGVSANLVATRVGSIN